MSNTFKEFTVPSQKGNQQEPFKNRPALEITDICKEYRIKKRQLVAVDHLSLTVPQGVIFGLLGPNGSGKTTTMNIISGLTAPTSGKVEVLGYDIHRYARTVHLLLGVVPQETALYEELSAWANMDFHADLFRIPQNEKRARIHQMLQLMQLEDRKDSRVATFSGGMKRRLAIGRALLHNPQLLYLDEPTLGVDVQSKQAIWDHILSLRSQGKTILMTTNYLEEADALCDQLAIIDHGKLLVVETPQRLREIYGGTILDLETDQPSISLEAKIRALNGVSNVQVRGTHVQVIVHGSDAHVSRVIALVASESVLKNIHLSQSTLNEIFLRLTGTTQRNEKTSALLAEA